MLLFRSERRRSFLNHETSRAGKGFESAGLRVDGLAVTGSGVPGAPPQPPGS
jgi:hypothetical protein